MFYVAALKANRTYRQGRTIFRSQLRLLGIMPAGQTKTMAKRLR